MVEKSDRVEVTQDGKKDGGAGQSGFSRKDLITITLSILAFVISATGFVSSFRQKDDVRVVVDDIPELNYLHGNEGELPAITIPAAPLQFTFINAGNRTAAVRSASLVIAQPDNASTGRFDNCRTGQIRGVAWNLKPFILKAGEVTVVDAGFRSKIAEELENPSRATFRVQMHESQRGRSKYMFACAYGSSW